jgi:hypothetical protein
MGKMIPAPATQLERFAGAVGVARLDGTSYRPAEHENLTFPLPEALQELRIQTTTGAARGNSSGAAKTPSLARAPTPSTAARWLRAE